jgi:hypothetical protein
MKFQKVFLKQISKKKIHFYNLLYIGGFEFKMYLKSVKSITSTFQTNYN